MTGCSADAALVEYRTIPAPPIDPALLEVRTGPAVPPRPTDGGPRDEAAVANYLLHLYAWGAICYDEKAAIARLEAERLAGVSP